MQCGNTCGRGRRRRSTSNPATSSTDCFGPRPLGIIRNRAPWRHEIPFWSKRGTRTTRESASRQIQIAANSPAPPVPPFVTEYPPSTQCRAGRRWTDTKIDGRCSENESAEAPRGHPKRAHEIDVHHPLHDLGRRFFEPAEKPKPALQIIMSRRPNCAIRGRDRVSRRLRCACTSIVTAAARPPAEADVPDRLVEAMGRRAPSLAREPFARETDWRTAGPMPEDAP